MKLIPNLRNIFLLFVLLSYCVSNAQNFNYQRTWATYFGDENIYIKDNGIDHLGNVYLVGRASGLNPAALNIATPGAYQTTFGGGASDGFIAKFNPDGNLIYSTYFGGENYDKIESVTIDKDDNVYIIGGTQSLQNIASANAFQTELNGPSDAFLAKFSPDGTRIWSTYYGGTSAEIGLLNPANETEYIYSGISCDDVGNLYTFNISQSTNLGTANVFQQDKQGSGYLVSKFTDGGNLQWATYYGINQAEIKAITCNANGVYVTGHTYDCPVNPNNQPNDYFGTPGSHQPVAGNCRDAFLTRFSIDGQRLWSTYYGGTRAERLTAESIKCFGNLIYIGGFTGSPESIATSGIFQENIEPNTFSRFLAKFAEDGVREWGTYCGNNLDGNGENPYAYLNIDNNGNPYLSGSTYLSGNIATSDSFQPIKSGNADGFVVKFNVDGQRIWGTYYGGSLNDNALMPLFYNDSFYIVGNTASTQNITTPNSYQPNFLFNNNFLPSPNNIFIAKFDPADLDTKQNKNNSFTIYPNPNNGSFQVSLNNLNKTYTLEIYDTLGQLLQKQFIYDTETINTNNLSAGIYFANIIVDGLNYRTQKIIIR